MPAHSVPIQNIHEQHSLQTGDEWHQCETEWQVVESPPTTHHMSIPKRRNSLIAEEWISHLLKIQSEGHLPSLRRWALRSQMAVIWTPILITSGLSVTKCVIIFFINWTKLLTTYLTPLVEWLTIHDESLVLRMWSSIFTLQPRNARFWHVEAHDKYILFSMFTIYSSCMQKEMNGVRFFYTNLVIRHQSAYFIHTVLWYFKWGRSTPLPCQQRSTIRLLQSQ